MIMKNRDEREARAYCETLEHVFAHYREIRISEACIMSMHEQLFKYSDHTRPYRGKYKYGHNKVETKDKDGKVLRVLVEGTPPQQAPQELRDLIEWFNDARAAGRHHPLILISAFLVEFLKIHPFYDGNGRVSRMLTNLLLLQAGYLAELYYPHEKLIEDDTESYYVALSKSQKTFGSEAEAIHTWTEYFLKLVHEHTRRAAEALS